MLPFLPPPLLCSGSEGSFDKRGRKGAEEEEFSLRLERVSGSVTMCGRVSVRVVRGKGPARLTDEGRENESAAKTPSRHLYQKTEKHDPGPGRDTASLRPHSLPFPPRLQFEARKLTQYITQAVNLTRDERQN
jgi:hypothetical protein